MQNGFDKAGHHGTALRDKELIFKLKEHLIPK